MSSFIDRSTRKSAFAGAALSALAFLAGCASQSSVQIDALAPPLPPLTIQTPSAPQGAALAAAAPQAESASTADLMTLGDDAPAPLGFLKFCGRRPDQCGLDATTDPGALTQTLIAKHYWAVAFASPSRPNLSLAPASGQAQDNWGRPQPGGRFDWSTVFGPGVATSAPAAFAARDASATVAMRSPASVSYAAPAEAASPAAGPTVQPLQADAGLMAELKRVNERINDSIRYVPDMRQFGVDDFWTLPLDPGGSAAGDCKDYVLEKRRALIDAGVPADDLSIAVVRTRWGEDHAVLLVATDQGELVLDSLSSRVEQWRKVPYAWIERQAPGQPLTWVKIVVDHRHADRPRQRVASGAGLFGQPT